MKNLQNIHTNNTKKEKEIILSLFRLPLTFFSKNSDEVDVKIKTHVEKPSNTEPDFFQPQETTTELQKVSIKNSIGATTQQSIESNNINNTVSDEIHSESEPQITTDNAETSVPQIDITPAAPGTSSVSNYSETYPATENISKPLHAPGSPEATTSPQSADTDTSSPMYAEPSYQHSDTQPTYSQPEKNFSHPSDSDTTDNSNSSEKKSKELEKDKKNNLKDKKSKEPEKSKQDKAIKDEPHSPTDDKKDNSFSLDDARNMKKKSPDDKSPSKQKSNSPLDDMRDMKKKNPDDMNKKVPKAKPGQNNGGAGNIPGQLPGQSIGNAGNIAGAAGKAGSAANAASGAASGAAGAAGGAIGAVGKIGAFKEDTEKIAQGSMLDKAEGIGDATIKGGAEILKLIPIPIIKLIGAGVDVVDGLIGKTFIGRTLKKALGGCVGCGCCSAAILVLLPIILFSYLRISVWGWIFGVNVDSPGIDDDARARLEQSITEDTLYSDTKNGSKTLYDILENRLTDPEIGFLVVLRDPITGNIIYDENGKQQYLPLDPGSFSDNYLKYELAPIGQFATAYEELISNYTVRMIKEPRHDTGMSSQHMPLFEAILEDNFTTLRQQFYNSQIPEDFWLDLSIRLNAKYPVYNPITGEKILVSLRDLLIETSSTAGDAEYDVETADAILNYTKDEQNVFLQNLFSGLQESIARVEVLSYMMALRNFYDQKTEFLDKLRYDERSGKAAENYAYFSDGKFFDQFLLIPDVESYMALSCTTATPAFAYDIAVNSMNMLNESNAPRITHSGKVYYFFETVKTWAAYYKFYNSISEDGEYSLVCTDIIPTKLEENLYKRYRINDPETFFSLFEVSTGIKISTEADVSTFFLVTNKLPDADTETVFPLLAKTSITHGYHQKYSQETVEKFGLIDAIHDGVDFSAYVKTPVLAIKSGTVEVPTNVDPKKGLGYYVKVRHSDNYTSIYGHGHAAPTIANGTYVTAGTEIMLSGNSGNSTGPHLHLEVRDPSGKTVNPIAYINGTLNVSSN